MSNSSKQSPPNSPPSKPQELTPEEKSEKVLDACMNALTALLKVKYPHLLKKKG